MKVQPATEGYSINRRTVVFIILYGVIKIDLNIFTPICMEINTTLMNYGIIKIKI